MTEKDKFCLSEWDKGQMIPRLEDKFVLRICEKLMETGRPLHYELRQSLGNAMLKVLSKPENSSKIADIAFQSINTSLQNALTGPLLLYSLLERNSTFIETQTFLQKIFTHVYDSNENKDIKGFIKSLLNSLHDPPYDVWFKEENIATKGGKRTLRKRKGKKKKKIKVEEK